MKHFTQTEDFVQLFWFLADVWSFIWKPQLKHSMWKHDIWYSPKISVHGLKLCQLYSRHEMQSKI